MESKNYVVAFFIASIILAVGVISPVPAKANQGKTEYQTSQVTKIYEFCKESKRTERTLITPVYECHNCSGSYTLAFPQDAWDPDKNVTVNKAYLDIVAEKANHYLTPYLQIIVNGYNDSTYCDENACRAEIQPDHLHSGLNELSIKRRISTYSYLGINSTYFTVEYTYTPTIC